ncbi:MAG: MSHA biogenesis protein MshN [Pseudohongiellaceae bacterium]|jgi:MSHA biogenesis protein MshN
MLNDLEQRKAQQPSREENLDWLTTQTPVAKKQSKAIYWVAALLLMAVAVLVYQQFFSTMNNRSNERGIVTNTQQKVPAQAMKAKLVKEEPVLASDFNSPQPSRETNKQISRAEKQAANVVAVTPTPQVNVVVKAAQKKVAVNVVPGEQKIAVANKPVAKTKSVQLAPSVKRVTPPTRAKQDSAAYKSAKRLLVEGDVAGAEALLQAFLNESPRAIKSNVLLLELLLNQGRLDDVDVRLQSLQGLLSQSADVRRLQAHYYVLSGKSEQAVKLLLSQQPDLKAETKYYELLALAAQKTGQYAVSIKVYKSLLGFDSSQGDWWVGLAISEELYGLKANARANFLQATRAGRIAPALRDYANQRHRALAGTVNVYPQTLELELHGG